MNPWGWNPRGDEIEEEFQWDFIFVGFSWFFDGFYGIFMGFSEDLTGLDGPLQAAMVLIIKKILPIFPPFKSGNM